ncbi:hydantoinase/oxoprolinase family protein [Salibacterium aidingense]|uniref:hydantoinase/oxoprolinase family protein n=1 Tax=Salibacterium aidingense TaxID=384933 RepID=UPI003BCD8DDA
MCYKYKLAVDVGGTFTDVVLFDEQEKTLCVTKTPSSPEDPSEGVINGIQKIMNIASIETKDVRYFVHGTTFATNAFLEGKGSETALLTTFGFRDVIEIGRQKRPKLYDLFQDKPSSLVERRFRFGIKERITAEGDVLENLNEEEVKQSVQVLKEQGITSIAVSYLHAYSNPAHEKRTAEIIKEMYPECHISLSHQISPEFREYERTVTTLVNAYLKPKTKTYFVNLEKKLQEIRMKSPYIMKSNGGIMTMSEASENVIQTLLSGPSGGVVAASFIAGKLGSENIITFDMGGTSTDVALIENQAPRLTLESQLSGYPLKVPMIEMETVGAGGGSLGWMDEGGLLKVGPKSAGAVPGPACYGNGGTLPAITDANLLLGRIDPDFFLGGEMELDIEASHEVFKDIIEKTRLSEEEAATGMLNIANHHMSEAVRLVSVRKGYDPKDFTLFAFGGASPLHATSVARELGIPKVVIPRASSVLSAFGFLIADIRHDLTSTNIMTLKKENIKTLQTEFTALEKQGRSLLNKEEIVPESQVLIRTLEMRFKGQAFEIKIELEEGDLEESNFERIFAKFFMSYEREYGYCDRSQPVEVVNYRLSAIGLTSDIKINKADSGQAEPPAEAEKGARKIYLLREGRVEDIPSYYLDKLQEGNIVKGPAAIDGLDTTIFVESDETAAFDHYGNIIISLKGGAGHD